MPSVLIPAMFCNSPRIRTTLPLPGARMTLAQAIESAWYTQRWSVVVGSTAWIAPLTLMLYQFISTVKPVIGFTTPPTTQLIVRPGTRTSGRNTLRNAIGAGRRVVVEPNRLGAEGRARVVDLRVEARQ